jgi:hypothetical protein
MNERTKLEERIINRQWRRWKRRGRIIAPFAALPLLLCTLILSIDIIEYSPKEPREKAVAKTTGRQVKRIQPSPAARAAISTPATTSGSVLDADRMKIPSIEIGDDDANAATDERRRSELARTSR